MTRDEIQKVRDALGVFEPFERKHTNLIEALDILDRALAAPEQEPFCYVNVNAQGDVTRTIKREDKWCKTPLYRHPAPQSQPVARVTGYYGGRCVIEPLDGKSVFPTGMAVYSAPVAAQAAQPTDCTRIMREQGNPYPRTCPRCKLGPCAYSPTIAITAPPSREWQSVTDEEIGQLTSDAWVPEHEQSRTLVFDYDVFARAIEAALRAKNSGERNET